jgi:hypothetical protein
MAGSPLIPCAECDHTSCVRLRRVFGMRSPTDIAREVRAAYVRGRTHGIALGVLILGAVLQLVYALARS